jgi:hypothetical protein
MFAQFAPAKINLKDPETDPSGKLMVFWHAEKNLNERECTTRVSFQKAKPEEEFL